MNRSPLSRYRLVLLAAALLIQAPHNGAHAQTTASASTARAPLITEFVVDLSQPGKPFDPGVRGIALSDMLLTRTECQVAIPPSLEVSQGTAIRGVAGGLYADMYDWKVRNGEPRPSTLQFLRWARDASAYLFITANTRGVVRPDPATPGRYRYYDTTTPTLAALAGDWVRYVNFIVPRYRQGDSVPDERDAAILKSLAWTSSVPGDSSDTLLPPGERPVPRIVYWEIGNEPTVSTSGGIGVNNGWRLTPDEFHERYGAVARAMKAEDPAIKVGPCVVDASPKRERKHLQLLLNDRTLPVDFIAYHPYQKMMKLTEPDEIEDFLDEVQDEQRKTWREIRELVIASGRPPDTVEMVASEVNVSDWRVNDTPGEGQMAHALGTVETVFTHARLGLTASHYWIWPAHGWDGTRYPLFKAYEMLRDRMGDHLIAAETEVPHLRVYATRSSATGRTAVWILNLSAATDRSVRLTLRGAPIASTRLYRLRHRTARTTLFSANLSQFQAGGPVDDVAWTEAASPNPHLGPMNVEAPAATITLLAFEP